MRITFGSCEVELHEPNAAQLYEIVESPRISKEESARLVAAWAAGAKAMLIEIEGARGARMERMFLEEF